MTYKLGSLFDGSGGFPLAGALCGVTPVWAAEVEPYPIAVTRSRFPDMRHLGDISKVSGADIEPVDIITFGSPCQDLSVAGKRAGLKHEVNGDDETTRSGLFMDAVRIIKEMREATNGEYPRFALWENVPGAFSSNKGEDFRTVLAELIGVVEPDAVMPPVPKAGWNYADDYRGDGWSLAYRVFDAQYWGVPQRRRRIHLVVDFRGERAREVLFEREGVRGYFAQGRTPWQGIAPDAEEGPGAADREGESDGGRGGRQLDAVAYSFDSLASNSMKSSNPHSGCRQVEVAKTLDTTDPNPSKNQGGIAIVEAVGIIDSIGGQAERGWEGEVAPCLKASHYKFPPVITQAAGFCPEQGPKTRGIGFEDERAPTLRAGVIPAVVGPFPIHDQATRFSGKRGDKADGKGNGLGIGAEGDPMNTLTAGDRHAVAYGLDRASFNQGANAKFDFTITEETQPTLVARGPGAVACLASRKPVAGCLMASGDEKLGAQEMFSGDYTVIESHSVYWDGTQTAATLTANNAGGNQRMPDKQNFNCVIESRDVQYIVRRLTPTECARLQGFADRWGDIDEKTDFTPEEYQFWLDVRNTHAAINGRAVKDYTEAQMLSWYNKLHTDAAEYKMWGNGIALPPALYCLQGMVDVLTTVEEDDAWML